MMSHDSKPYLYTILLFSYPIDVTIVFIASISLIRQLLLK